MRAPYARLTPRQESPMPIPPEKFKAAARTTYGLLKTAYAQSDNFWRLGHSFDTVVDYFAHVDKSDANAFASIAIQQYNSWQGDWYDDFGWWGIAGLKAAQSSLFGGNEPVFRTIALQCWAKMFENAPYGWERSQEPYKTKYVPLLPRGVWNHVMDSGCDPGDKNGLCGR